MLNNGAGSTLRARLDRVQLAGCSFMELAEASQDRIQAVSLSLG